MKKRTKTAIIIGISLIIAGAAIFIAVMFTLDFDFSKFDNSVYVTNTYEYVDSMTNIKVDVETADIKILPSDDEILRVVCYEKEKLPFTVTTENYTLIIESTKKNWYDHLSLFTLDKSEITLYLPDKFATEYVLHSEGEITQLYTSTFQIDLGTDTGDISVENLGFAKSISTESDTGDISIYNSEFDLLKAETDTGDIHLHKTTVNESIETETDTGATTIEECYSTDINSEASTGDITFRNTDTSNNIKAETSTGNITFRDSDGQNIYAKSSTGDITGTILSAKTFKTDSSTGKVSVPGSTGWGIFEAKTSTGNINISYSTK